MEIVLTQAQTLLLAMGVFFVGTFIYNYVFILKKFNIPEPVIGGLIFSTVAVILYKNWGIKFSFDDELRRDLMLTFFATVGLNAKFSLFKKGGSKLVMFVFITTVYLAIQNLIGVSMAHLLGINPLLGLLAGSITLSGGHGTGASYAMKFSEIEGAMEIAIACATFGLVFGGIIGGPVAEWLISKHNLAPEDKVKNPDDALKEHGFNEPEVVTVSSILKVLAASFLAIFAGKQLHYNIIPSDLALPEFIVVLFVGILITNTLNFSSKLRVQQNSLDLINLTSLSLFLSIVMMELKLWELVHLALPLLVIIGVQTVAMALFAYHVTFRVMGKDYQAATIASGHCGFGLGATPTAIANIESVTNRYGPNPYGMFIVLVTGSFFMDVTNALVIHLFYYVIH